MVIDGNPDYSALAREFFVLCGPVLYRLCRLSGWEAPSLQAQSQGTCRDATYAATTWECGLIRLLHASLFGDEASSARFSCRAGRCQSTHRAVSVR